MPAQHGFLFKYGNKRQWNTVFPNRPTILIHAVQFIISAVAQHLAYGNVHEADFFFFGEFFFWQHAQFSDSDDE
ncbi:MAG: hypothetical protein RL160_445 [Bacteroidota bacterium]